MSTERRQSQTLPAHPTTALRGSRGSIPQANTDRPGRPAPRREQTPTRSHHDRPAHSRPGTLWSLEAMNRKIAGSVAAAAVLAMGIAACGSSPKQFAASGKPLTIVTTAISPMTDNFNPFLPTSIGYVTHAVNLYNHAADRLQHAEAGRAAGSRTRHRPAWSNGGKTLTITTRSGREVERRQAVQREPTSRTPST